MHLQPAELNAILGGLRALQYRIVEGQWPTGEADQMIWSIVDDSLPALYPDQIDELCERLNTRESLPLLEPTALDPAAFDPYQCSPEDYESQ